MARRESDPAVMFGMVMLLLAGLAGAAAIVILVLMLA